LGHDRPRDADAHRAGLAASAVELPYEPRDGVKRRRVITWRGYAASGDLLTGRRQRDCFDLRSAQVDADAHGAKVPAPRDLRQGRGE